MTTAAEKRHKKLKKESWELNEPEFNQIDYDHSLLISLNYYANNVDAKLKRQWTLDYYTELNLPIKSFERLNDNCYNQTGALIRLKNRGVYLSEDNLRYILVKYNDFIELVNLYYPDNSDKDSPKKEHKTQSNDLKSQSDTLIKVLTELDSECDRILLDGVDSINVKKFITRFKLSKIEKLEISNSYKFLKEGFEEILKTDDEDLIFAYANHSKKNIKKFILFCNDVMDACNPKTTKVIIKKKKEKSPKLLVSKLKFKESYLEFKSIDPEKIIGASEVWIYNTKNRRIFRYKTLDGMQLTVKGSTINNWDSDLSGSKILRKESEQLKPFKEDSKSNLNKIFNEIKTIKLNVTGRVNSDSIIVRVF